MINSYNDKYHCFKNHSLCTKFMVPYHLFCYCAGMSVHVKYQHLTTAFYFFSLLVFPRRLCVNGEWISKSNGGNTEQAYGK